jgi:hypothetical protein
MTEQSVHTKATLLPKIEQSWATLNTALARLTEAQMTTIQDAQGWNVKDHLVHLTAWERSMIFLLQGKPRHEGLEVDEATYLNGTDDEINAVIQVQRQALSLDEVLASFRSTHKQLWALLQPLSDADLNQPYRHYLPDEPGEGNGPPVMNMIYGNTANHFSEHLEWIETLAGKDSS